jgi:hypothetical protein
MCSSFAGTKSISGKIMRGGLGGGKKQLAALNSLQWGEKRHSICFIQRQNGKFSFQAPGHLGSMN